MRKFTILLSVLFITMLTYAQTQLATPTVKSAFGVSTSGVTANWTAVANATSYTVTIYDAVPSQVTTSSVTGASAATLAITGLTLSQNVAYTYTITAVGDGVTYSNSAESAKSIPFYIQSADSKVVFKYAAADVATLNSDLKSAAGASGAADIYELTESGGAYTFSTGATSNNNTLVKNTIIRAAAGLANKPVLKLTSSTIGATANIIYTATSGLTVKLDGLELSGVNAGSVGYSLLAFYSVGANTQLYVTNCYFHDFLEGTTGNGTIRMDAISTAQVIDIQGSVFNNCGSRVLYNNAAANTPSSVTTINIKNCTFSNLVAKANRCNVVYNTAANGGTQTYDHCTFYNIPTSTTSPIYIKGLGGLVTIKNSLFSSVALTQPLTFNTTITDCYVGGLASAPTGTSNSISGTIATIPTYTNASTLDFSLINKSSFLATTDALVAGNTIYYSALPKLDSPVVGVASNIGTNGFMANWSVVLNATGGYIVKVYNGTTLVNNTPVSGQTSTSVAITGLSTGTTYTYTVTAVGDAINYDLSNESSASQSFSTLGLAIPVVGTASAISSNSFTANWTPVANASGYNVLTYLTSNLVSTTNVSGQATSSVSITGLAIGTTYTYKIVAVGDGVIYLNSDPSAASAVAKTLALTVTSLNPNFSDGTWGAVATSSPTLGSYPIFSANGWDLTHAQVKLNVSIGPKGEVHSNVLMLDKTTNSGVLTTPTIASVAEIEIHSSATAGRQYYIQSSIDGGTTWVAVGPGNLNGGVGTATPGTYYNNSASLEQIDIIPTGGLTNAQFKITDPASGAFTFYAIISRTTVTSTTTLPIPAGAIAASNSSSNGFTAIWQNTVTNATGYKVNVYSNKLKNLVTSATISNPSALSLAITGLQADSTYTYGVVGLGDNLTYSDGLILMASAPVITNLAAPIVSGPSNVSLTGSFTANWAAVNNASSYDVIIYDATSTQVGTPINVVAGTLSLDVSGLNTNTSYTYTVTAKGDGVLHFTSVPSAPVYVSIYTGLNNLSENSSITASGKTILTSEIGLFQVYNLQGSKIMETQGVNKLDTNLISGLYMVRFTNQKGQSSLAKVIIK